MIGNTLYLSLLDGTRVGRVEKEASGLVFRPDSQVGLAQESSISDLLKEAQADGMMERSSFIDGDVVVECSKIVRDDSAEFMSLLRDRINRSRHCTARVIASFYPAFHERVGMMRMCPIGGRMENGKYLIEMPTVSLPLDIGYAHVRGKNFSGYAIGAKAFEKYDVRYQGEGRLSQTKLALVG